MLDEINFVGYIHASTKRDYVARVVEHDKAECAAVAKRFDRDYWDGDRQYGYGGYVYDGRWRKVAEAMAAHYSLVPGMRVLDVGCGKAHLLYELSRVVSGIEVVGIDISDYGLAHAKEEVRPFLKRATAQEIPFADNTFDFVYSMATLHNLKIFDLTQAIAEIARVGRGDTAYVMVESYRNEREKANLLYWQLTCESFYSPEEWTWLFRQNGYTGDYGCIYFE